MAEQKQRERGGKKGKGNGEVKPVVSAASKPRGPRGSLRKLKRVFVSNGEATARTYAEKHGLMDDFNRHEREKSWAFTDTEAGRNVLELSAFSRGRR